jgi:DNA-binding beta-propeller fold protein YncE
MKRGLVIFTAAALAAAAAWAAAPVYQYAGLWGTRGSGPGQFISVYCIATAPNGNVYVTDSRMGRVQYFTPAGSYLGQWNVSGLNGVSVSSSGVVYVTDAAGVQYFTLTGSFLGSWSGLASPADVAVASNGNVYVVEFWLTGVSYYTSTGSFLGKWGKEGSGPGEFYLPCAIAVASNGNVYVVDNGNDRIQYFTSTGSFLGMWGEWGEKPGEFDWPNGIDVANTGIVLVANTYNDRVDYFTSTGSYLGIFGGPGSGPGQFYLDYDVAVSPSDTRVYVTDFVNARVQYFDDTITAVVPSSLGRVKALFR